MTATDTNGLELHYVQPRVWTHYYGYQGDKFHARITAELPAAILLDPSLVIRERFCFVGSSHQFTSEEIAGLLSSNEVFQIFCTDMCFADPVHTKSGFWLTGRAPNHLGQPDKHLNIQNYGSLLSEYVNGDPGTTTVELLQLYYFEDPAITKIIGKRHFAWVPVTFKLDKITGTCYEHGSLVHVRVEKGAAHHSCAWGGVVPKGYDREDNQGNSLIPGIVCSTDCLPVEPELAQDMDFIAQCN